MHLNKCYNYYAFKHVLYSGRSRSGSGVKTKLFHFHVIFKQNEIIIMHLNMFFTVADPDGAQGVRLNLIPF